MSHPFSSDNLDVIGGIIGQVLFVPVILTLILLNLPRVVIDLAKKDS